jgi:RimJ/RimL family protein N-acetyltransferase
MVAVDSLVPGSLVPRVETARLLLREPRLAEFGAFAANAADPVACANSGAPVMDAREAWRRFHAAAGHWLLQGMGWWSVEEKELGAIGHVGVFRRELGPDIEMGWSIYRQHWNNGYAWEAARAALEYAVSALGADRVVAYIAQENAASVRVATKIGMRLQGEVQWYGEPGWRYVFERRSLIAFSRAPVPG